MVARLVARHRPTGGRARRRLLDADPRPRVVRRCPPPSPTPTGAPTASTGSCPPPSARRWRPAHRRVVLVGDIAFVHDSGALDRPRAPATPICGSSSSTTTAGASSRSSRRRPSVPPDRFERLFGTPHGTDIVALAAAHGIDAATVTTAAELAARLAGAGPVGHRGCAPTAARERRGSTPPSTPPSAAGRSTEPASLRPDQRRQHRLELGLGLGQLGQRVAVGDDAAAGDQPGRAAVVGRARRSGASTAHVPLPAASTQPTAPP